MNEELGAGQLGEEASGARSALKPSPSDETRASWPTPMPSSQPAIEDEVDDLLLDDDLEETLSERLWGLTEMFPQGVRDATGVVTGVSWLGVQLAYTVGRTGLWVIASSAAILALPVMFETERTQMEEQLKLQEKQMLLGPNAALSKGGAGLLPSSMPQVAPHS